MNRCVIIGGADIADYGRIRRSLRSSVFCIYCDSGLNHEEGNGMKVACCLLRYTDQRCFVLSLFSILTGSGVT